MGFPSGWNGLAASQLYQLGLLKDSQVRRLSNNAQETVSLNALTEYTNGGVSAAVIGNTYWIEWRKKSLADKDLNAQYWQARDKGWLYDVLLVRRVVTGPYGNGQTVLDARMDVGVTQSFGAFSLTHVSKGVFQLNNGGGSTQPQPQPQPQPQSGLGTDQLYIVQSHSGNGVTVNVGDIVTIDPSGGASDYWVYVRKGDASGWVPLSKTSQTISQGPTPPTTAATAAPTAAPTSAPTATPVGACGRTTANVNVRASASSTATVRFVANSGEVFQLGTVSGSYRAVSNSRGAGFISTSYLASVACPSSSTPAPTQSPTPTSAPTTSGVCVTANTGVNVRSGPTTSASILFTSRVGEKFTVIARVGTWIQIQNARGAGYSSAQYYTNVTC